jgi:hypothetical protein
MLEGGDMDQDIVEDGDKDQGIVEGSDMDQDTFEGDDVEQELKVNRVICSVMDMWGSSFELPH